MHPNAYMFCHLINLNQELINSDWNGVHIIYSLVASEVRWGLATALPFAGGRTKTCVVKALGFRPDSGVQHSDDDITLGLRSLGIDREAHEIPWSSRVQLLFGAREHGDHSFQAWKIITQDACMNKLKDSNFTRENEAYVIYLLAIFFLSSSVSFATKPLKLLL